MSGKVSKSLQFRDSCRFAVNNVARHGDTDVFPFPIENHILFDLPDAAVDIMEGIHDGFAESLKKMPPVRVTSFSAVGYNGFRSATQIDPLWNAYFLALVVDIGQDIEAARLPREKGIVFSYRFMPDTSTWLMFDPNIGWRQYQDALISKAKQYEFVLACDIADFYPRIYHHRLKNALRKATRKTNIVQRIMALLSRFSEGVSYGLPIGGPAARLLSELLLNRIDRLLLSHGIPYCRFVDDFHLFAIPFRKNE